MIQGVPAQILVSFVNFYVLLIVIWAIFSWFPHDKGILADIYRVLDSVVRPFVGLFQKFIPPIGGIDISPIIAFLALQLVVRLLVG